MDVGSILGAITGGKNIQVDIRLHPPPQAVPLDHVPSWRLHRNPFWRVKHPAGNKLTMNLGASQQQQQQASSSSSYYQQAPQMQSYYGQQQHQQPYGMSGSTTSPYGGGGGGMMASPSADQYTYTTTTVSTDTYGKEVTFVYEANQDIEGVVIIRTPFYPGSKKFIEHAGIKVQFLGRIDMSMGIHEGRPHYDFLSASRELAPPGVLYQAETVLPFRFKTMDKELESYRGRNVAVRYIVKFLMERKFFPPLTKEHDIWVQLLGQEPTHHEPIKMEVGIEDCLHIEFEYDRRIYHLGDTVCGKIHFLLVRIKIKHMELAVIRRETSGEGVAAAAAVTEGTSNNNNNNAALGYPPPPPPSNVDANNIYTETQTLVKYEIMDGAPVKGEVIPVKLCLKGIPADLTPTYAANNNRFSVRYFLNLVLVDEDDRRYFKQQEIILWRKELG